MPIDAKVIFPNKIAMVTGASRGIGRNTVLSLAKCGVNSICTYNSNQAQAERVIGLVAGTGQKAIALQLDTGNVGAFDTFVQSVQSEDNRWINAERIEVSGGYVQGRSIKQHDQLRNRKG